MIGFSAAAIVRTIEDIEQLVRRNPFKNVKLTPHSVPHVTFLKDDPGKNLKSKYPITETGYMILGVYDRIVPSVVDLSGGKTTDLMKLLEKEFGKGITTRNWKTMGRILKG
jgi:uncharacterized protein (DUF1697 family)